ncbi:homoserine dehydrogenase [Hutsoniella sourekii]|uniref:homoserine dehydrogenase n=1 Tax=Hutsoniella sourekii TaxID=87650 RepID=UPI0004819C65|nr:homoserine dehydrogenase [Hutsoniella sourekii]
MKVAILGMGTVGSGVAKLLMDNQEKIARHAGEPIELSYIFSRSIHNRHNIDLTGIKISQDIDEILASDVGIIIETMGGVDLTYEIHKKALQAGKHVVSANKDMLALHVDELSELANAKERQLNYEASCAGGIPIVDGIQYGLNANNILGIMGILNGTTNYILSKMSQEGWTYQEALDKATELGYAEADPTNDVEGLDARRKICLLSRLAYEQKIDVEAISVRGISQVDLKDIQAGQANGYTLKLVGQSHLLEDGRLSISVEPVFLPANHQMAYVGEAYNAVYVIGDAVGETMFYGPGAGSLETASAIMADVISATRYGYIGNTTPDTEARVHSGRLVADYYLRFNESADNVSQVFDRLGVSYTYLDQDQSIVVAKQLEPSDFKVLNQELDLLADYRMMN